MPSNIYSLTKEEEDMVSSETRILINKGLSSLLDDPYKGEYVFPCTLSNIDRKLIHKLGKDYGFKTKSVGKEPNRFITVYKDMTKISNKFLSLTTNSQNVIGKLLASKPSAADDSVGIEAVGAAQYLEKTRRRQLAEGKLLLPRTNFQRTKSFREKLPIWPHSDVIQQAIMDGRVILVVGETGSGKTTQVPQIILEYSELLQQKCQIICGMPRRVAAVTISERVAHERGESLGETVGYQIRLESRISRNTVLTYCTNGVLLRSLLGGDDWLSNVSHIIIDEVHERDKLTDFTLIVLKDALLKYRNLKLILMSATIDCEKFQNYFKDCPRYGDECRTVQVPGKMYEVKEIYLEHILEGTGYLSSEMKVLKEEQDALRSMQGMDVTSRRNYARPPPLPIEQQIALMDPVIKTELDMNLDIVLNSGATEELKNFVYFLSWNGIPVDYQHPNCGRTALMAAAIHSDIDAVDDLIHMDPDLSVVCNEGKTALMYAEEAGDSDILEFFNAYMNYCEQKALGATSVHPAEEELSPEVEELVEIYEKCHIRKDIDEDLIVCVLKTIQDDGREGAVLVFLPGYEHIMCVRDKILQNTDLFTKRPLDIHILHSRMKSDDQRKVFAPPPKGHRKVILSTNIAETSVTISDVSFVIDCGKVKEMSYNSTNGAYTLECDWISKACAQQRKGRAGRTREGMCFRLYTEKRHRFLQPFKIPELLRQPIAELCLQAKQLSPTGTSIAEFLGKAIDPPLPDVTQNTINLLKQMEALTENEDLTKLGSQLLQIPVDPHLGKMIVYATILRCVDPVLTIVCCLSSGEMFKLPMDPWAKEKITQMRLEMSQNSLSDHLVYLNAFREWEAVSRQGGRRWCQENFISASAMEMIAGTKQQILNQLKLNKPIYNKNSGNWAVVKAAITAGLYPKIAKMDSIRKCMRTVHEMKVVIHSSSVLKQAVDEKKGSRNNPVKVVSRLPSDWILFEESHQIRMFSSLRTCTVVSPLTLCLFAGPSQIPPPKQLNVESSDNFNNFDRGRPPLPSLFVIDIDGFIHFDVDSKTAKSIQDMRTKWTAFVTKSINSLGHPLTTKADEKTLSAMVEILVNEDVPQLSSNPLDRHNNSGMDPQRERGRRWRDTETNWRSEQSTGRGRGYGPPGPEQEGYSHSRNWNPPSTNGRGRGFIPCPEWENYSHTGNLDPPGTRDTARVGPDRRRREKQTNWRSEQNKGTGRGYPPSGRESERYDYFNNLDPPGFRGGRGHRGQHSDQRRPRSRGQSMQWVNRNSDPRQASAQNEFGFPPARRQDNNRNGYRDPRQASAQNEFGFPPARRQENNTNGYRDPRQASAQNEFGFPPARRQETNRNGYRDPNQSSAQDELLAALMRNSGLSQRSRPF